MTPRSSFFTSYAADEPARVALFAHGFRPFFLAASSFAVVILPFWVLAFAGVVRTGGYLAPMFWHAHEMVFGFTTAVIAGFLLTAVTNWTKRETATGAPLLGLAVLWLLGRVVMSAPDMFPRGLPLIVDGAFIPAIGLVLGRAIIASKNRRNYVMLLVLAALAAANVLVHLDALGVVVGWQRRGTLIGIDVVLLLILVVAGRVVPMFTRNTTKIEAIRSVRALDLLALVAMGLVVVFEALAPEAAVAPFVAAAAALFAAARMVHWGTRHTLRHPLLWSLHLGYAWIPIGLALRALSSFTHAVPVSLSTHALTVGAIGSMTLSMMARVGLGHTGRPLSAPALATAGFVMIGLAAVVRVIVPLFAPASYMSSVIAAGVLWAAAFAAYVVGYARVLATARPDGKPG